MKKYLWIPIGIMLAGCVNGQVTVRDHPVTAPHVIATPLPTPKPKMILGLKKKPVPVKPAPAITPAPVPVPKPVRKPFWKRALEWPPHL